MNSFQQLLQEETYWQLPYENNTQYINDMLGLTYFRLKTAHEGLSPYTVLSAKHKINKKLSFTEHTSSFPLIQLQKHFQINELQTHSILISLLYTLNPSLGRIFSSVGEEYLSSLVCHCVNSFTEGDENWYLSYSPDFLKLFFQFPDFDAPSLWQKPLILSDDIKKYILDGTFTGNSFIELSKNDVIPKNPSSIPLNTILNIYGSEGSGKLHFLKQRVFVKKSILLCHISSLLSGKESEKKAAPILLERKSKLHQAPICFYGFPEEKLRDIDEYYILHLIRWAVKKFGFSVLITEKKISPKHRIAQEFSFISKEMPKPDSTTQIALWEEFSQNYKKKNTISFQHIVNRFDMTPGKIKTAVKKAAQYNKGILSLSSIEKACGGSYYHLEKLGLQFIKNTASWEDLILEQTQKDILHHACNYIQESQKVYYEWGFSKKLPYGRNLSILMEGPPGTGKTMAAGLLAQKLQLPLFSLNTAQVVSKYIGETEKNLNRIFNETEQANAILFIDEMDTLFGKRSQVKDSHDKYANMETSFLLQKIESYKGILILCTNFLSNVDEAFIRRIKFIVHFSLPTSEQRLKIWKGMFPQNTPLYHDVDFTFLAEEFSLSGGEIKNIALNAAFLAAYEKTSVHMSHILEALKNQFSKQGKILLPQDFGKYQHFF